LRFFDRRREVTDELRTHHRFADRCAELQGIFDNENFHSCLLGSSVCRKAHRLKHSETNAATQQIGWVLEWARSWWRVDPGACCIVPVLSTQVLIYPPPKRVGFSCVR
jgi:hypothetical protein